MKYNRNFIRDVSPALLRWFSQVRGPPALTENSWANNRNEACFDIDWTSVHYNRIAVINLICVKHGCNNYLEIGCDTNECFDAVVAQNKIGIDPVKGGTHRLTSDEFFLQNGNRKFDVVFIDGDHTYEQARQDLLNSLSHLSVGGWIVLHDMFPRHWREEHVPRASNLFWTGEVWKLAFELIRSPDVEFKLLKIDHGVGVVRKLKENPIIPDLRPGLGEQRFRYFYENVGQLPIVDFEIARAWIENAPSASDLLPLHEAEHKLGVADLEGRGHAAKEALNGSDCREAMPD